VRGSRRSDGGRLHLPPSGGSSAARV